MSGARRAVRRRYSTASVAFVVAAPLLALADLRGSAALVAALAAAAVLGLQTLHVTRGMPGQAFPAVIALCPWVVGVSGGIPRPLALVGGVAVLAGAELARMAADQGDVPLDADPPGEALAALVPVVAMGAGTGTAVLLLGLVRLGSAGVLVALGAVAAVAVAATLSHPRSMLGRALDRPVDEPKP